MAFAAGFFKAVRPGAEHFSFSFLVGESPHLFLWVKMDGMGEMMYSANDAGALDYAPCRYNGSRLWFRGPRRSLGKPYVACLGGSEVYGRFVLEPFADRLERLVKRPVVNLGVEHAGPDAYLNDAGALQTAIGAGEVVLHLGGVTNCSNRLYSVHPRRNDRFLKASDRLRALYPEMDYTDVHFVGHLLQKLRWICETRFETVIEEVRAAWAARTRQLVGQLRGRLVLLWMAPGDVPRVFDPAEEDRLCLIDQALLTPFLERAAAFVPVVPEDWDAEREAMVLGGFDLARAAMLPTPGTHALAAERLAAALQRDEKGPPKRRALLT